MGTGSADTDTMLRTALASHPDVFDALGAAHSAAWAAVDAELLAMCNGRIALLLGHDEEVRSTYDPVELTATQQACLNFTDQFVIDVASIDDQTVAAVAEALGANGLLNFVNALLVVEQRQRLRLLWTRLLPEVAA
jgi:hypothetical protein